MSNFHFLTATLFFGGSGILSLNECTEILSFHAILSAVGAPGGSPIEHSHVQ
ncbi:hypothetical protein [Nitrosomonas supralitoralis]|uniref:hypothetical protein n=1 Tax=Nitrosomonas supralitoralis TaxID=2116706 RepID=UPI00155952EE|nr:hypothetical protein [Nitrosomonas supralitoralis]